MCEKKKIYNQDLYRKVYFHDNKTHFHNFFSTGTLFETEAGGNSEMAYCTISILQLFRERLSVKRACDNRERYCGIFKFHGFLSSAFQDILRK